MKSAKYIVIALLATCVIFTSISAMTACGDISDTTSGKQDTSSVVPAISKEKKIVKYGTIGEFIYYNENHLEENMLGVVSEMETKLAITIKNPELDIYENGATMVYECKFLGEILGDEVEEYLDSYLESDEALQKFGDIANTMNATVSRSDITVVVIFSNGDDSILAMEYFGFRGRK